MAKSLHLRLIAPEGIVHEGPVAELRLPTPWGEIKVLPEHMPLVTAVDPGVLTVRHKAGEAADHFAVGGGVLTVTHDGVALVAETAEHAGSIDELRAHQALAEAQAALRTHVEEEQIAAAEGIIERNLARLAVTKLRRRR